MSDELREKLRAKIRDRLNAPPDAPIEATRRFLQSYLPEADSFEDVRRDVAYMLTVNARPILEGLAGIEGLLENPPDERDLLVLVAYDANWVLEDRNAEGAKAWLRDLGQVLREELQKKNLLPDARA